MVGRCAPETSCVRGQGRDKTQPWRRKISRPRVGQASRTLKRSRRATRGESSLTGMPAAPVTQYFGRTDVSGGESPESISTPCRRRRGVIAVCAEMRAGEMNPFGMDEYACSPLSLHSDDSCRAADGEERGAAAAEIEDFCSGSGIW